MAKSNWQVILPLVQGMLWTLLLSGWRYWNRGAQFQGASLGSKFRRWWWWNVNNWTIPEERQEKISVEVGEVSGSFLKVPEAAYLDRLRLLTRSGSSIPPS